MALLAKEWEDMDCIFQNQAGVSSPRTLLKNKTCNKQLNLSNENLNVHENCPRSIQISSTNYNRRWYKFLLKTGIYFVKAIIRWKLFFFFKFVCKHPPCYFIAYSIFLPDLRQKKQTLLLVENPTYVITSISTNSKLFSAPK